MDWRQRKTTQKKKDWKMGGLIEVDGNDDNEESYLRSFDF